ncbi:MAG: bifunctional hydroxymethylpyrimidine kinase/phosphomethylpyrimidine kinase, partial [Erysipelotrichaceae bacterium]|nr:bifunctional hydroxymethylpyrimidine kinase/phosphomethylpyrimidine kinase [Erysipelotrichaceae bacterium]
SNAVKLGGKSLSAENIRDIDALSLASLFRAPLDDPKKVLELVVKAKSEGAYVFADTKLPVYKKLTLEDYAEVLPYIDLIFPNETEAAYYSGISGDKEEDLATMADVFLKRGVKAVVIKTGEQGSWYFDGKRRFHHPAFAAEVVDTTGAGDNYAAGFIHAYLNKEPVPVCMAFASACAALSVAASGATGGVRSLQQIENYLQKK